MYGFIVNRASGNGTGKKVWKKVEKELMLDSKPYLVRHTERPADTAKAVTELFDSKVKAIIAVGGDGTINEVVNRLVPKDIPLGVIPAGSGNDFARCLGIPMDYKKALRRIFENNPVKTDLLYTGSRYCLTVTGIGFDGKIAETVNRSFYKSWFNQLRLGKLTYVASMLEVLKTYKPTNVKITIDNEELFFSKVWLVAVANAPNYGGGIRICPEAVHNDGLLDICIAHGLSRWELLRLFPKAYKGGHLRDKKVSFFKGKDVYLQSDTPVLVQGDGELIMTSPVRLQIKKDALQVM